MSSAAPSATASTSASSNRARIFFGLKLAYAIVTGCFSAWLASFAPAEGSPIAAFIPATAAASIQIRDGGMLLREVPENSVLQSLLDDPDIETLYGLKERRDELLAKYANLPAPVRWLFPPTIDGMMPVFGRDFAAAALASGDADTASDGRSRGKPVLAFVRLSGARGLLVRLALRFAPAQKSTRFFDLGGGLIAVGFEGGAPAASPQLPKETRAPKAPEAQEALARVTLRPQAFKAVEHKVLSVRIFPQLDLMRGDGVPENILSALQQPPSLSEMFGAKELPSSIDVELFRNEGGGFAARGTLAGDLPAPTVAPNAPDVTVFDEMFLPINAEAAFLRYLESEMHLQGATPTLSKGQRRWSRRLFNMEEREVDLHTQLWPAFGSALYLTVQDPPDDINTVSYGVIKACVPFDGRHERARYAAGELAREKWDDLFDGPAPKSTKPPFVRRVKGKDFERYVLMTGQINAPSWTLSDNLFCFTSDAGPFAVRDAGGALPAPPWKAASAPAYFVKFDGPRSATTAEALADVYFSTKEDALGAHEFLAQYPNAELQIKLVGKLTRLLGKISVEIKPDAQTHSSSISGIWTPATAVITEQKQEEAVPPPPPPAN